MFLQMSTLKNFGGFTFLMVLFLFAMPSNVLPENHQRIIRARSPVKENSESRVLQMMPYEVEDNLEDNHRNLSVSVGDTAFLQCYVQSLEDRSITWYRRQDWNILTSGTFLYTRDERIHIIHLEDTDEWTLQIKFVRKEDNGTYECQVSTGNGILSYLFHLHVVIPEVFIAGNKEYHVEQGSTIDLMCMIEKSPKIPEYIFWFHNDQMINYGVKDRDVFVQIEPSKSRIMSRLVIYKAQFVDAGNYTCQIPNGFPASVSVYVIQGDKIAAFHRRMGDCCSKVSLNAMSLLLALYLLHIIY